MIKIDEKKLDKYVIFARDASFRTGIHYFGSNKKEDKNYQKSTFLAFTLLPIPFPRNELDFAIKIQFGWNELLLKLSTRIDIIFDAIKDVIENDEFVRKLWKICEQINLEGNAQKVSLNIIRSDYLLDKNKNFSNSITSLSQVEINTFACGGCAIPEKIKELHKYMLHITDNNDFIDKFDTTNLYDNITNSLLEALSYYEKRNAHILLVIRDVDYTYGDHRLIEYGIFEKASGKKFFRLTLTEIAEKAIFDDQKRLFIDDYEIGLIYYKAGFHLSDYPTEKEWISRLMLERSKAIKAPKIEFQIMNTKIFQQYLYEKNVIEEFISDKEVVNSIRSTFVRQYSFKKDIKKVLELINEDCEKWVLKPQREGGGFNYFGQDIKNLVSKLNDDGLKQYVLMERIKPLDNFNYVIHSTGKSEKILMNSELGVFGIVIGDSSGNIYANKYGGCLVKSKDSKSNEGGIMIGLGAFDSLILV